MVSTLLVAVSGPLYVVKACNIELTHNVIAEINYILKYIYIVKLFYFTILLFLLYFWSNKCKNVFFQKQFFF